jgi:hypothetical protein
MEAACRRTGRLAIPGISMTEVAVNASGEIARRKAIGLLTWSGPALMLFARLIFSVLAQGLVAGVYGLQSSPTPWRAAAPWLPVYATLIDAACLDALGVDTA